MSGSWQKRRRLVYERDMGICRWCRERVPEDQATMDHYVPRSRGGPNSMGNLVVACRPCNQRRGNSMPLRRVPIPLSVEALRQPFWAFDADSVAIR